MNTKQDVLYCSDQNYFALLKLSIFSLIKYNRNLDIHIFTMDAPHTNQTGITQTQVDSLNQDIWQVDRSSRILLHDVQSLYERLLKNSVNDNSPFTPYAGLRLLAPEFFKDSDMDLLLYLDCDTIICSNLRINQDVFDEAFVAMSNKNNLNEALLLENPEDYIHLKNKDYISFCDEKKALLSGVIYFNLKKIKQSPFIMDNIIEFYNDRHLNYPDQEALAFVPYNKYRLDSSYTFSNYINDTKVLNYHYSDHNEDLERLIENVSKEIRIKDILDDDLFQLLATKISGMA